MFDMNTTTKKPDPTLQTALWEAAQRGQTHEIRKLVVAGADVTLRDDQGRTAINIASQYGHAEAYRTLMAAREMSEMMKAGFSPDQLATGLSQEEERLKHYR